MEAVRRLHDMVAGLESDGVDRIALIAHSMGGLIACYYLRYGTQDMQTAAETWEGARQVATVVLVGVPFGGSMTVFRNMTYGRPIGLNKALLNFEAMASFPGSYYLLPSSGSDVLLTQDGTERQGLISDASNWARYQWGLLREKDDLSSEVDGKRSAYISLWLQQTHRFNELLHAPSTRAPGATRSLMSIVGRGQSTLARGYLNERATGRSSIRFDDAVPPSRAGNPVISVFADGDGTVTREASILPEANLKQFTVTRNTYEAEHIELLNRDDIQRDILNFVVKELAGLDAPVR